MYLKEITVKNFRSIKNAKVKFNSGINFIIGPNGSGKSNLISFIDNAISYRNFRLMPNNNTRGTSLDFSVTYELARDNEVSISFKRERALIDEILRYKTTVSHSAYDANGSSTFVFHDNDIPNDDRRKYHDFLKNIISNGILNKTLIAFNIPSRMKWLEEPYNFTITGDLSFEPEFEDYKNNFIYRLESTLESKFMSKFYGSNYHAKKKPVDESVIKRLIDTSFGECKKINDLVANLQLYSPIQDIRLGNNINYNYNEGSLYVTNLIIEFKVNNNWIVWNQLSDGTKRLFYIISQALSDDSRLLLIEEPELGIHPSQLYKLMDFLSSLAEERQIVISTHSPIVLDILSPEQLNCITVSKIGPKGSSFKKLSKTQIQKARSYMEDMELSYYWLHSDLEKE